MLRATAIGSYVCALALAGTAGFAAGGAQGFLHGFNRAQGMFAPTDAGLKVQALRSLQKQDVESAIGLLEVDVMTDVLKYRNYASEPETWHEKLVMALYTPDLDLDATARRQMKRIAEYRRSHPSGRDDDLERFLRGFID